MPGEGRCCRARKNVRKRDCAQLLGFARKEPGEIREEVGLGSKAGLARPCHKIWKASYRFKNRLSAASSLSTGTVVSRQGPLGRSLSTPNTGSGYVSWMPLERSR